MEDTTPSQDPTQLARIAAIVTAYVSNNSLPSTQLPVLISTIHASLISLTGKAPDAAQVIKKATPAEIRQSITPDVLISFEDGKPYKTLRRHLTTRGITVEAYRDKWGLPSDYPMTSATYSAKRAQMAKRISLGRRA